MKWLKRKDKKRPNYSSKRCPNCATELPLRMTVCLECKQKLGEVDRYGIAKKPTDWKAYTICIIAWTVFIGYVYWAFIYKKT